MLLGVRVRPPPAPGHVEERVSNGQRGRLQVPPQHADGEEAPSALQGDDSQLHICSFFINNINICRK